MGRRNAFLERAAGRCGRRGGTSVTAGRTSATYVVHMPNGRSERKRTFKAIQPWATAAVYEFNGTWYVAGIYDVVPRDMQAYNRATAERVA